MSPRKRYSECTPLSKKAWSQKLLTTHQFITEESQNKGASNKSWFTVYSKLGNKYDICVENLWYLLCKFLIFNKI
jgi:hypothetical protein